MIFDGHLLAGFYLGAVVGVVFGLFLALISCYSTYRIGVEKGIYEARKWQQRSIERSDV